MAVVDPRIGLVEPIAHVSLSAGTAQNIEAHVVDATTGQAVRLPTGSSFFGGAHFVRDGPDLLIMSADGQQVLVRDYFALDAPPDLVSGSAQLSFEIVRMFVGPLAPGQSAQAANQAPVDTDARAIGRIESLSGDTLVTRADGTQTSLGAQSPIFTGDIVQTAAGGRISAVLADGSIISMDGGTRLAIVDFVFDGETGSGRASLALSNGVLAVAGGDIAASNSASMVLTTPVASVALRGALAVGVSLPVDGGATVALLSVGSAEGAVVVTSPAGGLATLDQARESVEVGSDGAIAEATVLSTAQTASLFGAVLPGLEDGAGISGLSTTELDDAAPFAFPALTTSDAGFAHGQFDASGGIVNLEALPTTAVAAGSAPAAPDVPPPISLPGFTIADVSVSENAGVATFTVSRGGNLSVSSLISLSTAAGTATVGDDFIDTATAVLFAPGVSSQTFSVALTDDSLIEGDETFQVTLDVLINGTIDDGVATATIIENDTFPQFSIVGATALESAGAVTFTISRSGNLGIASTVDFSTTDGTASASSDYGAIASQTVNFAIGSATQTVSVSVVNDGGAEVSESIVGNLTNPVDAVIASTPANAMIRDNEFSATAFDGSNGFLVNGLQAAALAGYSVSSAGDVNGDGFSDFIVGAPYTDIARADIGTSYLVFGSAAIGAGGTLNLDTLGTGGVSFQGFDQEDLSGFSVAGVGDINNDGNADLAIAAPRGDQPGEANAGEVVLVLGGTALAGGAVFSSANITTVGLIATGTTAQTFAGTSVAAGGDLTGDGLSETIIGVPRADTGGRTDNGVVGIVFGNTAATAGTTVSLGALGGSGTLVAGPAGGNDDHAFLGQSVANGGDIFGNGHDDLILGAPGAAANAGEVYVIAGGQSFAANIFVDSLGLSAAPLGFKFVGDAGSFAGRAVAGAGDVNGDGLADILIGAPLADLNGTNSGSAYLVFGTTNPGAAAVNLSALSSTTGIRIDGIAANQRLGYSVAGAGDINGDGFDDFIVGMRADPDSSAAGNAFVVFGGNRVAPTGVFNLRDIDGTNGLIISGADNGDLAGLNVRGAGDINGDGFDDLLVGAPGGDPAAGGNAGESYVVFGADFSNRVTATGTSTADTLSGSAAADVIIGGAASDVLNGGGGADVLRAGQGNDTLNLGDTSFFRLDGGLGTDTIGLAGSGLTLDLTAIRNTKILGVEAIDLTGTGANALTLNVQDLLDLSPTSNTLRVLGGTGDTVDATANTWADGGSASGFHTYTNGLATLLIDDDITQNVTT